MWRVSRRKETWSAFNFFVRYLREISKFCFHGCTYCRARAFYFIDIEILLNNTAVILLILNFYKVTAVISSILNFHHQSVALDGGTYIVMETYWARITMLCNKQLTAWESVFCENNGTTRATWFFPSPYYFDRRNYSTSSSGSVFRGAVKSRLSQVALSKFSPRLIFKLDTYNEDAVHVGVRRRLVAVVSTN